MNISILGINIFSSEKSPKKSTSPVKTFNENKPNEFFPPLKIKTNVIENIPVKTEIPIPISIENGSIDPSIGSMIGVSAKDIKGFCDDYSIIKNDSIDKATIKRIKILSNDYAYSSNAKVKFDEYATIVLYTIDRIPMYQETAHETSIHIITNDTNTLNIHINIDSVDGSEYMNPKNEPEHSYDYTLEDYPQIMTTIRNTSANAILEHFSKSDSARRTLFYPIHFERMFYMSNFHSIDEYLYHSNDKNLIKILKKIKKLQKTIIFNKYCDYFMRRDFQNIQLLLDYYESDS